VGVGVGRKKRYHQGCGVGVVGVGRKKRYHQGCGVGVGVTFAVGVGVTRVGEVVTVTVGAEVVVGEGETVGVGVTEIGVGVVIGELMVKNLSDRSWVAEPTPPCAASTIFILCNPVFCMIGEFTIHV